MPIRAYVVMFRIGSNQEFLAYIGHQIRQVLIDLLLSMKGECAPSSAKCNGLFTLGTLMGSPGIIGQLSEFGTEHSDGKKVDYG